MRNSDGRQRLYLPLTFARPGKEHLGSYAASTACRENISRTTHCKALESTITQIKRSCNALLDVLSVHPLLSYFIWWN